MKKDEELLRTRPKSLNALRLRSSLPQGYVSTFLIVETEEGSAHNDRLRCSDSPLAVKVLPTPQGPLKRTLMDEYP